MLEIFGKDDTEYLNWIKKNPKGFVINKFRSDNSSYKCLHKATCVRINQLPSFAISGGFTTRQYVKVCGNKRKELINKYPNPRECSFCKP